MRLKKLSLLLALTLLVSVSALPVTAHAGGSKDTTPPTLTASLEGDALKIESSDDLSGVEAVFVDENRINSLTDGKASVALKDYAGTEKQVSIYAKDYAGNRSDVVKLDNPYYKEPAPEKKPAAAAPQSPSGTQTKPPKEEKPSGSNAATPSGGGNSSGSDNSTGQQENTSAIPEGAFTPEGTGTVQDNISGTDGEKQFYTITTDAGNVFYLVIDGKREDNNVYFLNGVTESDLMALAEKNNGSMSMIPQEESCNCTEKCEAGKVNTGCPVCKNDLSGCKGKEKPTETEKPAEPEKPKKETGSVGTILFILAASTAFSRVLTLMQVPQTVSAWILAHFSNEIVLLIIINVFLLIVGMVMDTTPAILILSPILLPIVQSIGKNPIHFGVVMIVNLAIGFVTPPIGVNLFVASSLTDVPVMHIAKKAMPMIGYFLLALLLLTFIPAISLFLL